MQCRVQQSLHESPKDLHFCSKHSHVAKHLLYMFKFSRNKILKNVVFQKLKGFVQNFIPICLKYFNNAEIIYSHKTLQRDFGPII